MAIDSNSWAAFRYFLLLKYSIAALYFASASLDESRISYWVLQEETRSTASAATVMKIGLSFIFLPL